MLPDGNTISATEHSVTMILAMARNIPQAYTSLKNKEWNRKAFKELNYIKSIRRHWSRTYWFRCSKKIKSFGMTVLVYDPF